jgi:hypothetical protein
MQLSDEDLKALSTINVEEVQPLTQPQRNALGRIVQSIRTFLGQVQEEGATPSGGGPELVK